MHHNCCVTCAQGTWGAGSSWQHPLRCLSRAQRQRTRCQSVRRSSTLGEATLSLENKARSPSSISPPFPTLPSVHGPVASRPDSWKAEACLGGERASTEEKPREGKRDPRVEAQNRGYLEHPVDRRGRPASSGPGTCGTGCPASAGTLVRVGACTQWTAFWTRGLSHSLTCDVAGQHKGVGWNSGLQGTRETLPGEGLRCGERGHGLWSRERRRGRLPSLNHFPFSLGLFPANPFARKSTEVEKAAFQQCY